MLFAPVYLANYCVNSCTYCAFRGANKGMERSMLTMDELRCALSSWSGSWLVVSLHVYLFCLHTHAPMHAHAHGHGHFSPCFQIDV